MGAYIALFYYQLGALVKAEYWVRDATYVKEYICERTNNGPRILIIAGSNCLFGIDSKIIKEYAGYDTVNLATHGALPIDYLFKQVRTMAKAGDLVIMPLELAHYTRNTPYTKWFVNNVMTWGTSYFADLPYCEKAKLVFSVEPIRVLVGAITKIFENRVPKNLKGQRVRKRQTVLSSDAA